MKITQKKPSKPSYTFAETCVGDVFQANGHTYMSVSPGRLALSEVGAGWNPGPPFNAVILDGVTEGHLENIAHDTVIQPMEAELLITPEEE